VRTFLTFSHALPRLPAAYGGVERFRHDAFVPTGNRTLEELSGRCVHR
jgi:hypothetical protein